MVVAAVFHDGLRAAVDHSHQFGKEVRVVERFSRKGDERSEGFVVWTVGGDVNSKLVWWTLKVAVSCWGQPVESEGDRFEGVPVANGGERINTHGRVHR